MKKAIQPNEIKMAEKLYESGIRGISKELQLNLGVSKNRALWIMKVTRDKMKAEVEEALDRYTRPFLQSKHRIERIEAQRQSIQTEDADAYIFTKWKLVPLAIIIGVALGFLIYVLTG